MAVPVRAPVGPVRQTRPVTAGQAANGNMRAGLLIPRSSITYIYKVQTARFTYIHVIWLVVEAWIKAIYILWRNACWLFRCQWSWRKNDHGMSEMFGGWCTVGWWFAAPACIPPTWSNVRGLADVGSALCALCALFNVPLPGLLLSSCKTPGPKQPDWGQIVNSQTDTGAGRLGSTWLYIQIQYPLHSYIYCTWAVCMILAATPTNRFMGHPDIQHSSMETARLPEHAHQVVGLNIPACFALSDDSTAPSSPLDVIIW